MEVYKAISSVMATMAKEGISKDRKNQQQGYNFRGIDDVYNALGKVLAENKLILLPRVTAKEREERTTAKGGLLMYTILTVEFDIVSAEDGSKHTVCMIGEAMDSADKSANKAQSAALKYAAMQVFMIPTEGDNDADAHTHQVVSRAEGPRKADPVQEPKGPSKNEEARKVYKYLQDDLAKITSVDDCRRWWKDADVAEQRSKLPVDWAKELQNDWAFTGKKLAAHEAGRNIGDAVDDIVKQTGDRVVNETVKREQSPLEAG